MFRIYKDLFRRLFVVTLYLRELGYTYTQANEYVKQSIYKDDTWNGGRPKDAEALRAALKSFLSSGDFYHGGTTLDEMATTMAKQLSSTDSVNDRDLIDTIVRVIGLPHARNILAGGSLNRLREAILLPEELIDLKAQLAQEAFCYGCGHQFLAGEMSTFVSNGGVKSGGEWACTRCHKPSYVASERDTKRSLVISQIKGLEACLKKKHIDDSDKYVEANKDGWIEAANEILGQNVIGRLNEARDRAADVARNDRFGRRVRAGMDAPPAVANGFVNILPDGGLHAQWDFRPDVPPPGDPE